MSVGPGDILQLAKTASRLGNSFSNGPTGAASEFHEIKLQLSSLSAILESLIREIGKPGRNNHDVRNKENLGEMIYGCKTTLHRLETIVEKYTDKLDSNWSWKLWFSKGYKLILWTTNGGDIRELKDDLQRHHQLIDAYINVLNRADIHASNVLDRMLADQRQRQASSHNRRANHQNPVLRPEANHVSSSSRPKAFEGFPTFFASSELGYKRSAKVKMNFSISRRSPVVSICPEATVNPDFFIGGSLISPQPMFSCTCRRGMKGVLAESHSTALGKIKCGPGTIIVKNESSDLMQREYSLYSPRIEEPGAVEVDNTYAYDDKPYIISIPLRKNQRAFEASLVQFLSNQAATCLADGVIQESKWVRWENDTPTASSPQSNTDTFAWGTGNNSHPPTSKTTRGRVLVACSVRLGVTAESTIKSMNLKYLPPNNSSWAERMTVKSLMIIQYRSIRKQKLYQSSDETDPSAWQDGDYLKMYLDFAKVSEYLRETKSLRCDFVWEEKIRITGPAVTFKVRDLRHFEDEHPVEGAGTLTYLGDRVTITAGAGSSNIKLDRWNMPKLPANQKAVTNESALLIAWTQPLHEQLRNFWSARISRKEEIRAIFRLNTITVKSRPDIFGQDFYSSQLVIFHEKSTKSTRLVVRSASGYCVVSQDVSDRKSTKIDLQEDTISLEEPMANVTTLVPGREKDGPSLRIRQEPNTISYQFADEQDAVACICIVTELGRGELVVETMALEDAASSFAGSFLPGSSAQTTIEMAEPSAVMGNLPLAPTSPPLLYAELPTNHVRRPSAGNISAFETPKGYELDVEIFLDESHQIILCPHATVNPALFLSFDAIGQASLPLFACKCKSGTGPHGLAKQHELGEYRAGAFTLPILALGSKTSKNPGCFVIVNVSARDLTLELYIRCPDPRKERQFEDVMASLLRMRVATNLAIVGMRPSPDLISVHNEDSDSVSVLAAFGNLEIAPSADIRIEGTWQPLCKSMKEVSISQYFKVGKKELASRLSQDPNQHSSLFDNTRNSVLQFKAGDKNFTCLIKGAPKIHPQPDYITLTMEVEDMIGVTENAPGSFEDRRGSGRLRLRFEGGGKATQLTAARGFGWFKFWRNRLKMKKWFIMDDDEEAQYTVGVEEVLADIEEPKFFDAFFNNGKLSLLKNEELSTARIMVESFSNDRVLSQDILPCHFPREQSFMASLKACCTGDRIFMFSQDFMIADKAGEGEPRCWRLAGGVSYLFPTIQTRNLFCENLDKTLRSVSGVEEEEEEEEEGPSAAAFELESSFSASRAHPTAVELPTFEFSMPTLLRRATLNHNHPAELDDNDYDDSDAEGETDVPALDPIVEREESSMSPRPPQLSRSNFLDTNKMIRPSRSFVKDVRLSPVPSPERLSRSKTPSPKPLIIPPPPPLPAFPDELTATPIEPRRNMFSTPQSQQLGGGGTFSSPLTASTTSPSPRSATTATFFPTGSSQSSSRDFANSRSPSRSTQRSVTYRAWAQYDAKKEGEMNVRVGDTITVDHEDEDEDAVWGVRMQGRQRHEGWVPKWCLTQVQSLDFSRNKRRNVSRGRGGDSGEWDE